MSIDCPDRLSLIEISGDPYDAGVALGRFGVDVVNSYLSKTPAWASIVAHRNDPRVLHMADLVREIFPHYWLELTGLAHGLALPFDEVFAWNCRGDIRALAPDGCTTVQVPGPRAIIAHNEDGDPGLRGYCALAHFASAGATPFTAFVYPGSLPGHTFAKTDMGLVQTVNNIRASETGGGLPRMVLTRAVLDCQNLDEAVQLIRTTDKAGAFHLTLAQAGDPRLLSLEFASGVCSVQEITKPSVHANHFIHDQTSAVHQIITDSSASRQIRGDDLIEGWQGGQDPLSILCDKKNKDLPIQRDDLDDPDHENTLAAAVFSIEGEVVNWDIYEKADQPMQLQFRDGVMSIV